MSSRKKLIVNSFEQSDFKGKKMLVIVPHQDDEILVAGNMISFFSDHNAEIYVLYSTCGNIFFKEDIRIREAERSLSKLSGGKKVHILLLGFPDYGKDFSLYDYDEKQCFADNSGRTRSYGANEIRDYSFIKENMHSAFTLRNYKELLRKVILDVYPDYIVYTGIDTHCEHTLLSLTVEEVVKKLVISGELKDTFMFCKSAYPYCLKGPSDYFEGYNNISTVRPESIICERQSNHEAFCQIGRIYDWDDRVRFILDVSNRQALYKSRIFKALKEHTSQGCIVAAEACLNSDDVYFEKRIDNIALKAKIIVSSGNGVVLNDFRVMEAKNIKKYPLDLENYVWKPSEEDEKRTIRIFLDKKYDIQRIVLYGDVFLEEDSYAKSVLELIFYGEKEIRRLFDWNGKKASINDLNLHDISCVDLRVLKMERGKKFGISEIEIFENERKGGLLNDFIKILINGDFVYEYVSDFDLPLTYDIYKYSDCDVEIKIEGECNSYIEGNNIFLDQRDQIIQLVAYCKSDNNIFDKVIIRKKTIKEKIKYLWEIAFTKIVIRVNYIVHMWYLYYHIVLWQISNKGIIGITKRVIEKIHASAFRRG